MVAIFGGGFLGRDVLERQPVFLECESLKCSQYSAVILRVLLQMPQPPSPCFSGDLISVKLGPLFPLPPFLWGHLDCSVKSAPIFSQMSLLGCWSLPSNLCPTKGGRRVAVAGSQCCMVFLWFFPTLTTSLKRALYYKLPLNFTTWLCSWFLLGLSLLDLWASIWMLPHQAFSSSRQLLQR